MDLYEYQGRALLAKHGLPVLDGAVASTPAEAGALASRFGGRVVVKAQVKTGGRGKAGGVALAATPQEASQRAATILGMTIKGQRVGKVMVTPAVDIAQEYYLSYLIDRSYSTTTGGTGYLAVAAAEGGVEIERLAKESPDRVVRVGVAPDRGVDAQAAAELVARAGFPRSVSSDVADVAIKLWRAFVAEDATLIEVNPLARTSDGRVLCLDAKVIIDDSARFRHPDHARYADQDATDPLELRARERNLNYVKLDGQVGIIGNGAGLVMSTLDVVAESGRPIGVRPANFLDLGGGANAEVMADGLQLVLADPDVRVVFVNIFGGITECDQVALGILKALDLLAQRGERMDRPLVIRLDGNKAERGRQILHAAAHPFVRQVDTMDSAARSAALLADDSEVRCGDLAN